MLSLGSYCLWICVFRSCSAVCIYFIVLSDLSHTFTKNHLIASMILFMCVCVSPLLQPYIMDIIFEFIYGIIKKITLALWDQVIVILCLRSSAQHYITSTSIKVLVSGNDCLIIHIIGFTNHDESTMRNTDCSK